MGLNDTYLQIRSQILLMDPLPPVVKAYSLILQSEAQRLLNRPSFLSEVSDMAAMGNYSNDKSIYIKSRSREHCSHYHVIGHSKKVCYKLHGYSSHYKIASHNNKSVSGTNSITPSASSSTVSSSMTAHQPPQLTMDQYKQLLHLLSVVTPASKPQSQPC